MTSKLGGPGFIPCGDAKGFLRVQIPGRAVTAESSFVAVIFYPEGRVDTEVIGQASPAQMLKAAMHIVEAVHEHLSNLGEGETP